MKFFNLLSFFQLVRVGKCESDWDKIFFQIELALSPSVEIFDQKDLHVLLKKIEKRQCGVVFLSKGEVVMIDYFLRVSSYTIARPVLKASFGGISLCV